MAKILVIEDENLLREEILEWLTLEDYDAVGAPDGMAGLQAVRDQLPDLIVSDITMPKLDGYGVLLELNATPTTAGIPFIFMTARASQEDIRQGMNLGADDYITKPFTRLELLQAIETRLQKRAVYRYDYENQVDKWHQAFIDEREERLLQGKLVAMFAHDFRIPLSIIMSSLGLIRNYAHALTEERREKHFDRVEASVHQLTQMLDDMLLYAQMGSGRFNFEPEVLDVGEFLQGIVDEFRVIHDDVYHINYENRLYEDYRVDTRLLRQVATNLISNAIKYSPHNSRIDVSISEQAGDLVLLVEDNGIGIPEADQGKLFELFHRASNVGEVKGTGIGLAIVKRALDLHGGAIKLESKLSQGTRVTVNIPAQALSRTQSA